MPAEIGLRSTSTSTSGIRCAYRALIAQLLGFEAAFPALAGTAVFPIGATSDGLHEASLQPGQAAQTRWDQGQTVHIGKQALAFDGPGEIRIFTGGHSNPALGGFRIASCSDMGWIHRQHPM